jgi:hypothetical protein
MASDDMVAGVCGGAIAFDGVNDYASTLIDDFSVWPVTLFMGLKQPASSSGGGQASLSKHQTSDHSIWIRCQDTGLMRGSVYHTSNLDCLGVTAFDDYEWIDVVFVCTSNTDRRLYVNGGLDKLCTTSQTFPGSPTAFSLGCLVRPSPYFDIATIDDAGYSTTVLSPEWIKARYHSRIDNLIALS